MATPPTFSAGAVLTAAQMNQLGLFLIKSQAVGSTAVPSVVVTDVFSADYTNYRIVVSGVSTTNSGISIGIQLENSTSATYLSGGIFASFGSTVLNGYGPAASSRWPDIFAADQTTQGGVADIYQPFETARTTITAQSVRTGGANAWYYITGIDTNAVSHSDFTIIPVSGNMANGTISVYGYRK
jgi:hypothetical protein